MLFFLKNIKSDIFITRYTHYINFIVMSIFEIFFLILLNINQTIDLDNLIFYKIILTKKNDS